MSANLFTFKLDSQEFIKMDTSSSSQDIHSCDEVIVKFHHKDNEYVLSVDCIKYEVESLYGLICATLGNKASKHSSILHSIGYSWNEEMNNKPGLVYEELDGIDYWVGLHNLVWSTPSNSKPILSTWLYNDSQGAIILEITPRYPWRTKKHNVEENYTSYEEWMKMYQPLFIETISRDVAMQWKKQVEMILNQLTKSL